MLLGHQLVVTEGTDPGILGSRLGHVVPVACHDGGLHVFPVKQYHSFMHGIVSVHTILYSYSFIP